MGAASSRSAVPEAKGRPANPVLGEAAVGSCLAGIDIHFLSRRKRSCEQMVSVRTAPRRGAAHRKIPVPVLNRALLDARRSMSALYPTATGRDQPTFGAIDTPSWRGPERFQNGQTHLCPIYFG